MSRLTAESLAAVSAEKLAGAVRAYCNRAIECDVFVEPSGIVPPFARALLAAVDRFEKLSQPFSTNDETEAWCHDAHLAEATDTIRAIAASLIADGVELSLNPETKEKK